MANIHRPVGGQWGAHIRYLLLLFLRLCLLRGIRSCVSSTASLVQKGSCAADAGATQCHENGTFLSIPKHTWHEKPSHQCQNLLLPEIFGLHHNPFILPNTAMEVSCIPTAQEITSEPGLSSSQLQPRCSKIYAAHVHQPKKSCPRCQTGPWRASLSHFTCWTVWSPRFTCWDELTHLLGSLSFSKLSPVYKNWKAQFEQNAILDTVRVILIFTLIIVIYILVCKMIAPDIQSSPTEMGILIQRQRHALKQFTRAVDELLRKILSGNRKRKLGLSVRRVSRIRGAMTSFRKKFRRLVNRRKWTVKELSPSRYRSGAQHVTGVEEKEADATTNEAKRPWSLRWHNFNVVHMSMLPSEGSTSGVHAYVQKQRQDEEKLINFWCRIFRKRNRKYCHRGLNKCKDTPYRTQQMNTGFPRDAFQQQGRTSGSDVHSNASFSVGAQQEVEHIRRCMYNIFYAFLKDASEWRYWQRNEQMNFLEVVMDQVERWRKLQMAFEGGILESTFKLTIITNSIVRKFQDISIYLTGEEMKGSKLVRFATTRGKGAATAAVEAHSNTWAHLTEAALDARLVRQMNFFRTHFEEQKKLLYSATAHTRQVENGLEQVCHDHMRRLTTSLQKSFDREVEKHLSLLTHQQPHPTPATRIRKDLEDMKDTQKKLVEHCHALAGAAQEFARQHFQDQQEQLDRMATKLHMILDRHMERDRVQEQKLQQMLDACSEKNKKQLAIALEKTNSQGGAATASLLQQQTELRRMCEAHKDQGERITHMVEGLIRQQKTQQSTAEQGQDTSLTLERNLVKVFREELQAAKKEMAEKLSQIEQQNRATQCCSKEKSSAELERMVNSVTSQLQQQRQEQRSLHETLLIQRRDTLELLKHFTNLAISPEPQQLGSSEPHTTAGHSNNNVRRATAVHSNAEPFVYSEGFLNGDSTTANETAEPRHPFQTNPGFQRERQTPDSISLASAIASNMQGGKQLHHVVEDQTRGKKVPLLPFPVRPPLAVQAEETACRSPVLTHTDSCQKQQGRLPMTSVNWTQLDAGAHLHTEQFEQLLERWKRSVSDAEVIERNRAKLVVGPGRLSHDTVQTRQKFNLDAQLDRSKMDEPSCTMKRRHACGGESFPIDSITQLFCTSHLIPNDSQSVTDLTSPVHALQCGGHQAGRKSVVPCSNGSLVTHAGASAILAEEHGLALGKGRDGRQLGVARAAQLQHNDIVFQSPPLQQRLREQKQQPAGAPQYEGATPDLHKLVLDWGND